MDNNKELITLIDEQIKETIEDIEVARYGKKEEYLPLLEKLKVLQAQKSELEKIETRNKELEIEEAKNDLERIKVETSAEQKNREIESDTALRIRELELKEKADAKNRQLEEEKQKEQKKQNTIQGIIGAVTAATGIAGIIATVSCFKKALRFEETGSFTNKSAQAVGGLLNIFKRR